MTSDSKDGSTGAACPNHAATNRRRCLSLFKDECTADRGCAWNLLWIHDNYAIADPVEARVEKINGGPTIFGACISTYMQDILIANFQSPNRSTHEFNYTAWTKVWRAPGGPEQDVGTCPFAMAQGAANSYSRTCRNFNSMVVHPEFNLPTIKGVAIENGTVDIQAGVDCVANGCYVASLSGPYMAASLNQPLKRGHFECVPLAGIYESFFLNQWTDGGVWTYLTECGQQYRRGTKEMCEAVKIKI
ncbi:hypothetical protein HXX76_015237 [Chlamydomonas incerta]|uniref:Uncharacterized protein n=1 Tax=Chlamydomonas incerta TaxID=51695 RepID=A0A835SAR6_CHLIN|nr:hypothetical protein HXX76_015237 [Chlamydomonas incerta]|eukprot:KAG2423489.1 hypothetical protein HXX76_015237 [Chlamydomonas incerta]